MVDFGGIWFIIRLFKEKTFSYKFKMAAKFNMEIFLQKKFKVKNTSKNQKYGKMTPIVSE
jgi:hypothetical protein